MLDTGAGRAPGFLNQQTSARGQERRLHQKINKRACHRQPCRGRSFLLHHTTFGYNFYDQLGSK